MLDFGYDPDNDPDYDPDRMDLHGTLPDMSCASGQGLIHYILGMICITIRIQDPEYDQRIACTYKIIFCV